MVKGSPVVRAAAVAALLWCVAASATAHASAAGTVTTYRGACDASAAVALDAQHFVVGNDENDILATYRLGDVAAVGQADLTRFLGARKGEESDVEGAAVIGSRIYWVASHSRNSRGVEEPSRHRIFATDIRAGTVPAVEAVGTPYRDLLRDLLETPALAPWKLGDAARLAPEADGGLNIEGLAATPQGGLLVGFRGPLRARKALVVPIDNPADVVTGTRARIGPPMELDLGGRGIRSMDLVGSQYYVVAGPVADTGTFALYRWSGQATDAPVAVPVELGTLRPEALFAVPGSDALVLVSDDGGLLVDGKECKRLKRSQQTFRALRIQR